LLQGSYRGETSFDADKLSECCDYESSKVDSTFIINAAKLYRQFDNKLYQNCFVAQLHSDHCGHPAIPAVG
jgi:hypothetical protein